MTPQSQSTLEAAQVGMYHQPMLLEALAGVAAVAVKAVAERARPKQ